LIKIELLKPQNIDQLNALFLTNLVDYEYFKKLNWNLVQILSQLKTDNNQSFSLWKSNKLIGFIIGNLISIEKKLEYEILLIYVDKKFRKLGFASKLINVVSKFPHLYPLCKITLEVSENNIAAINLYKKNKFSHIGERKNYYNINKNFNENALIFEKKINE